jgi:ACR3 family arsenite efflux pump ArsB
MVLSYRTTVFVAVESSELLWVTVVSRVLLVVALPLTVALIHQVSLTYLR